MNNNWEFSFIVPSKKSTFNVLPTVSNFVTQEHFIDVSRLGLEEDLSHFIGKDKFPLPITEDREGYHDNRHYDYWLSGLEEFLKISKSTAAHGVSLNKDSRIFDFGCSSGRILRHFALQTEGKVWGCDINEDHVSWCNTYLPSNAVVFQNTSLPHLQVEDEYFDCIYALSVFTHIDIFETSWLAELRRALKPNGIAYITIHDETSWQNMPKTWGVGHAILSHPEFKEDWLDSGFPNDKFVSRWNAGTSYSSNVFYRLEYINKVWSKFFDIKEIIPMGSNYQTVLVLQKSQ